MAGAGSLPFSAAPQAQPSFPPAPMGSLLSMLENQRSMREPLLFRDSEWAVSPPTEHGHRGLRGCLRVVRDWFIGLWTALRAAPVVLWEFGRKDLRKPVFAAKNALALALISLLSFMKGEPFKDLASHVVWAILTVVVVFEFSIGATLSKGFNRGLGTLSAGGLALGVAYISTLMGSWEEITLVASIFIVGFLASFIKLYPTMKAYEYGFRVFMITFIYVMVSGYKTGEFTATASSRFILIAFGAVVGLGINVCIYPIWAGEDLHNLVAKNFSGLAKSLEECVSGYLRCMEYERIPSKILTYQACDDPLYSGYRSALESTSQEDNLLSFAIWEPPHGPYKLGHPWGSYTKVGGALRHCAFMVMALHGCVLSEIQAPPESRQVFRSELQKVGAEGAKVLRELGDKVKTMTKLSSTDILIDVHLAAEELQKKIDEKSYLLVNSESWKGVKLSAGIKEAPEVNGDVETDEKHVEKELGLGSISYSRGTSVLSKSPGFYGSISSSYNSASMTDKILRSQLSWPARQSFHPDIQRMEDETRTYESASALSLATFASLLIEFVARLQNLVDAFDDLSKKANCREAASETAHS